MTTSHSKPSSGAPDGGFTLIELLIVIVVLGVLAAITVFAVRGISDQGQTSACETEDKTLSVAIEAYFANALAPSIPPTGSDVDRYERTLVSSGLLRSTSTLYDVDANGDLALSTGSPC